MYIEREINSHFKKVNNIYSAIALVGPRQAGKTTFLKEHIKHQHSSYVLFDDPDARALFEEDIKKMTSQSSTWTRMETASRNASPLMK